MKENKNFEAKTYRYIPVDPAEKINAKYDTTQKKDGRNIVCFSLELCQLLLKNGCRIVAVKPNTATLGKLVFYFEHTELALKIVSDYNNQAFLDKLQ